MTSTELVTNNEESNPGFVPGYDPKEEEFKAYIDVRYEPDIQEQDIDGFRLVTITIPEVNGRVTLHLKLEKPEGTPFFTSWSLSGKDSTGFVFYRAGHHSKWPLERFFPHLEVPSGTLRRFTFNVWEA